MVRSERKSQIRGGGGGGGRKVCVCVCVDVGGGGGGKKTRETERQRQMDGENVFPHLETFIDNFDLYPFCTHGKSHSPSLIISRCIQTLPVRVRVMPRKEIYVRLVSPVSL